MLYLTNGFSPHMFGKTKQVGEIVTARFETIDKAEAADILQSENFRSYFGHSDTAPILERLLHVTINPNRGIVQLRPLDRLIIASLDSTRRWEQGLDTGRWFYFWYVTFTWRT